MATISFRAVKSTNYIPYCAICKWLLRETHKGRCRLLCPHIYTSATIYEWGMLAAVHVACHNHFYANK